MVFRLVGLDLALWFQALGLKGSHVGLKLQFQGSRV